MISQETLNKMTEQEQSNLLKLVKAKEETKQKLTERIKDVLSILGYVLAGLGGLGYLITIITLVKGIKGLDFELMGKDGLFFIIGFVFGLWIRMGFYIQGITYAKEENQTIIKEYHSLKVKDKKEKKLQSFEFQMALGVVVSVIMQFITFSISSLGLLFLASFEGMNNPIYIANAVSNLVMFMGFGFLALVSTYEKYNNLKIPVLKERVRVFNIEKVKEISTDPVVIDTNDIISDTTFNIQSELANTL